MAKSDKMYRKQRATILAAGALARQATRGEFAYTQNALDSIYGNLGTTLGGGQAALTKEQKRLLGAVQAGVKDQRVKSTRITNQAKGNISRLYGSAALGSTTAGAGKGGSLDKVYQVAKSGQQDIKAKLTAGGQLARGNKAAMATLQQGADMARAGADAQLADALAYRAKNDAALQAEAMLELQKLRLQNQLDLENYKAKLAMEDEAAAGSSNASAVASSAAEASQTLFGYMGMVQADGSAPVGEITKQDDGTYQDEEGNVIAPMNAAQAAQTYINNFGVTDENEMSVIFSISRALFSQGAGQAEGAYRGTPKEMAAVVQERLSFLYPDLSAKQRQAMQGMLTASFRAVGPGQGPPPSGGSEGTDNTFITGNYESGAGMGRFNEQFGAPGFSTSKSAWDATSYLDALLSWFE